MGHDELKSTGPHPGEPASSVPRPAAEWGAFAACSLIWGSTFLFISLGNDALAPVWAASLRLALASLIIGVLARLIRHPFPRGEALRTALVYGVLQFGVNFALLYWGEKTFPSGLTAVLYATIPLSTALLARAHRLERLSPFKLAGAGVALAGVALIFSGQRDERVGLLPAVALFAAATIAAWSGVLLKRGPRQSPLWANAVGSMAGLVICLVVSFAARESHPIPTRFAAWFPVVYLTCAGSVGAFVFFAWLINHWPVTRVSFIGVVTPVAALVLGWLVRNERLTLASLAGSALVIVGVVLGLRATESASGRARNSSGPPARDSREQLARRGEAPTGSEHSGK
jgi:drug/metabolite transporter (DMT)-like permease